MHRINERCVRAPHKRDARRLRALQQPGIEVNLSKWWAWWKGATICDTTTDDLDGAVRVRALCALARNPLAAYATFQCFTVCTTVNKVTFDRTPSVDIKSVESKQIRVPSQQRSQQRITFQQKLNQATGRLKDTAVILLALSCKRCLLLLMR